jgi:hypothetical protein
MTADIHHKLEFGILALGCFGRGLCVYGTGDAKEQKSQRI